MYGGESGFEREGFFEDGGVFGDIELGEYIVGVSGHVDYLHRGVFLDESLCEFGASHLGQDNIRNEQFDIRVRFFEEFERVLGEIGREDLIVVIDEQSGYTVAHRLVIFDHKDSLAFGGREIPWRCFVGFLGFLYRFRYYCWQKDAE